MIRLVLFALFVVIGITIYFVHSKMGDHNLIGATTDVRGWHTLQAFRRPPLAAEDGALRIGTNPMAPGALPVVLFRTEVILDEGQRYVISFDAKADPARHMELVSENDNGRLLVPARVLGLKVDVALTSEWQHYDYTFLVKNADRERDRVPRLQFDPTDAGGSVWFKNMRLDRIE